MPKIQNPQLTDTCFYCGAPANYISVNTKKMRCCEKQHQCPGIIKRQQSGRDEKYEKMGSGYLSSHMKKLSERGHIKLKELNDTDEDWKLRKSINMSKAIEQNGGRSGENNPHFGKEHSDEAREKMRVSASTRDNSNIGKYQRTDYHRNLLSQCITQRTTSGRMRKNCNTKPEQIFKRILDELNIQYTQQFLIQYGLLGKSEVWFRHCYDFFINGTNFIVEIDGDYWHRQPATIKRDLVCQQIATERGYTVIRFWEKDLKNNPSCILETVKYLLE